MQAYCLYLAESRWFQNAVIGLIVVSALLMGVETVSFTAPYRDMMHAIQQIILGVFIIEIIIKHLAFAPEYYRFYKSGWNVFDLVIVIFALIPAAGEFAVIARVLRLLRILRLISALPQLRIIVTTLIRSIPSIFNVVLLLSIVFYIYAVAGYHLFHEHDPEHWRNLGIALLTLFRVVTLEDWTDVMYTAMEMSAYAWIYFVSFVVLGTFVVINLFIAVVLDSLENAKQEQREQNVDAATLDDVRAEIAASRKVLDNLHRRLMVYELETAHKEDQSEK